MSGSFCLNVAALWEWKWQHCEPGWGCCKLSMEENPLRGGSWPLPRFQGELGFFPFNQLCFIGEGGKLTFLSFFYFFFIYF